MSLRTTASSVSPSTAAEITTGLTCSRFENAEPLSVCRLRLRDHDITERQPAFRQVADFPVRSRRRDVGSFGTGNEKERLVKADSLIA